MNRDRAQRAQRKGRLRAAVALTALLPALGGCGATLGNLSATPTHWQGSGDIPANATLWFLIDVIKTE